MEIPMEIPMEILRPHGNPPAEQFYTGLGFSPLPESFWKKSDLYPLPPDSKRKKEHTRFLLAYRSRERHPLAAEH